MYSAYEVSAMTFSAIPRSKWSLAVDTRITPSVTSTSPTTVRGLRRSRSRMNAITVVNTGESAAVRATVPGEVNSSPMLENE